MLTRKPTSFADLAQSWGRQIKAAQSAQKVNPNRGHNGLLVESRLGVDGNYYGILQEADGYFIKTAGAGASAPGPDDFAYIGGLGNRNIERFASLPNALHRLHLKMGALNESAPLPRITRLLGPSEYGGNLLAVDQPDGSVRTVSVSTGAPDHEFTPEEQVVHDERVGRSMTPTGTERGEIANAQDTATRSRQFHTEYKDDPDVVFDASDGAERMRRDIGVARGLRLGATGREYLPEAANADAEELLRQLDAAPAPQEAAPQEAAPMEFMPANPMDAGLPPEGEAPAAELPPLPAAGGDEDDVTPEKLLSMVGKLGAALDKLGMNLTPQLTASVVKPILTHAAPGLRQLDAKDRDEMLDTIKGNEVEDAAPAPEGALEAAPEAEALNENEDQMRGMHESIEAAESALADRQGSVGTGGRFHEQHLVEKLQQDVANAQHALKHHLWMQKQPKDPRDNLQEGMGLGEVETDLLNDYELSLVETVFGQHGFSVSFNFNTNVITCGVEPNGRPVKYPEYLVKVESRESNGFDGYVVCNPVGAAKSKQVNFAGKSVEGIADFVSRLSAELNKLSPIGLTNDWAASERKNLQEGYFDGDSSSDGNDEDDEMLSRPLERREIPTREQMTAARMRNLLTKSREPDSRDTPSNAKPKRTDGNYGDSAQNVNEGSRKVPAFDSASAVEKRNARLAVQDADPTNPRGWSANEMTMARIYRDAGKQATTRTNFTDGKSPEEHREGFLDLSRRRLASARGSNQSGENQQLLPEGMDDFNDQDAGLSDEDHQDNEYSEGFRAYCEYRGYDAYSDESLAQAVLSWAKKVTAKNSPYDADAAGIADLMNPLVWSQVKLKLPRAFAVEVAAEMEAMNAPEPAAEPLNEGLRDVLRQLIREQVAHVQGQ